MILHETGINTWPEAFAFMSAVVGLVVVFGMVLVFAAALLGFGKKTKDEEH